MGKEIKICNIASLPLRDVNAMGDEKWTRKFEFIILHRESLTFTRHGLQNEH